MGEPQSVLLFSQHLPTPKDPVAGVFVYDQAEALQQVMQVALARLVSRRGGPLVTIEREADPMRGIPTYAVSYRPGRSVLNYAIRALAVWRIVTRMANEGCRPDVLHVHWWSPALPIIVVGKLRRIPVVITEHGSHWSRSTMKGRRLREGRLTLRLASVVLPVSEYLADVLRQQGVKANMQVTPNIIDRAMFHPAKQRPRNGMPVVITVARLVPGPSKGIDTILEATGLGASWRLVIVGDGPDRPRYEQLAIDLGVESSVEFVGHRTREEIAGLLGGSDVFVSATPVSETFGVATAEALASGTPVVATNRGAMPEMVTADVGVLIEPSDPHTLAAAISDVLHRQWAPEAISATTERFSAEVVRDRLLDIYRKVTPGRR